MKWEVYKLRFQLLSPLHIGYRKIGNIQQTRRYVIAKNLWAAMTVKLTQQTNEKDYEKIGHEVNKQLAFTYLFPEDHNQKPLIPQCIQGRHCYGLDSILSEDEFTWRYLNSYASTALNYEANSAEEGSLHEVEYLAPFIRNQSNAVFLSGYVFVQQDCALLWKSAINELQIGGERKTGWGRLKLASKPELENTGKLFDTYKWRGDQARPQIIIASPLPILAHTKWRKSLKVEGSIEPLVGRTWNKSKGAGQGLEHNALTYIPGSLAIGDEKSPQFFELAPAHIWEAKS